MFWGIMNGNSCNDAIRKQVALKEERKALTLMAINTILIVHALAVVILLEREGMYLNALIMMPETVHSLTCFLLMISTTSILLMYPMIAITRHATRQGLDHVGVLFACVPSLTALWHLVPLLPCHCRQSVHGICCYCYVSELQTVYEKDRLGHAMQSVAKCDAQHGQCVTHKENMNKPLHLSCRHIFCEDCVSEWFERKRTCPLCRAVVNPLA